MILKTIKDVVDAYRGIDVKERNKREQQKRELAEREYREKNFSPIWAKRYSIIITIMYALLSVFIVAGAISDKNMILIIKTIFLGIVAISGAIMMNINNKKIQKYGCMIYSVFVVIELITTFKT